MGKVWKMNFQNFDKNNTTRARINCENVLKLIREREIENSLSRGILVFFSKGKGGKTLFCEVKSADCVVTFNSVFRTF